MTSLSVSFGAFVFLSFLPNLTLCTLTVQFLVAARSGHEFTNGTQHVRAIILAPLVETVSWSTHYMHSSSVTFRPMDLVSAQLFSVASCGFKVSQSFVFDFVSLIELFAPVS